MLASYGIFGVYQSFGAFLVFITVMKDFGIPLESLFGLAVDFAFKPNYNDVYDKNAAFYGHTNPRFIEYCTSCWDKTGDCDPQKLSNPDKIDNPPDWLYTKDMNSDLRLWYLKCAPGGIIENVIDWHGCSVKQISRFSELPVCYSTEMLKFAQTAFFVSIVYGQYTNAINTKTRKTSFRYAGLNNYFLVFGWYSELMLVMLFCFWDAFNVGIGTRPLILLHFGWQIFPFVFMMLAHDEIRKYLSRTVKSKDPNKPNWWYRNTYW